MVMHNDIGNDLCKTFVKYKTLAVTYIFNDLGYGKQIML